MFADFMNLDDVGMLQAGDGLGLGAEALEAGSAGVTAAEDHLERDLPAQSEVLGLVNDTHPSAAQFGEDLVSGRRTDRHGATIAAGWRQGRGRCIGDVGNRRHSHCGRGRNLRRRLLGGHGDSKGVAAKNRLSHACSEKQ
jgi:hypothetical protein